MWRSWRPFPHIEDTSQELAAPHVDSCRVLPPEGSVLVQSGTGALLTMRWPNHGIQRMRASRSDHLQFLGQRRLDAGRWADMTERGSETYGRQATTSADD